MLFLGCVSVQKVIRGLRPWKQFPKKISSPQICSGPTLARENPKKTRTLSRLGPLLRTHAGSRSLLSEKTGLEFQTHRKQLEGYVSDFSENSSFSRRIHFLGDFFV